MSDYSITKSRTLQWVVIIVVLFTLAGAYWYFQARAAVNLKAVNETGLVGYWPMNEGAGTRASDFSGSGNTGTLTNGPTWVDGKFGKAVSFNGTNKAIDLGKHLFKTIQVGSLSVWVKSNSFTGSQIVYEAATWNAALSLAWPTASNASLSAMLGSNTAINGSKNNFALNTWYHVVLTWDGTHVIFYVNGAVDNNLTDSGVPNNSVGSDNTQIGRFSYAGASSTGGYFNGSIDDVRIYSRALSATEITNLYALGTATVNASQNTSLTTGLVGQWSFNGQDISGTTAYDRSGADNNGTLTNGPAKVPGKIGQALTFNGSTNYVSVPNASSLNPTNVTVAAWVKTSTTGGYIIAKDPPNDLSAGQVASSVTASAEKQPVNLLGQSLTIKNIAVSITAYKNISILLALFLLSIFGLGFYKSKQKKISANSIVSAMVIFVLLISPFLFSSYATAAGGCSPSSRYWVGGTGTWDASDTTHWSTTSGGAGGASVPLAMNSVAIFDASSGGGAVTLGFSPSILSIIMGAFTGTFDAATFSPTLNACSSTAFSGTGTGTRTLNMGSGTWTVSSGSSPGNPWDITNATNLTLNAQTSTVKIISSSGTTAYNFTFAGGNQIYNNVWFARGTDTGNNVVSGSNTFNNFKDDGSVAHILIFTAGTTQTVSTFTVSGTAGNVITLGSGATATHALVKTGGGTISSDYLDIRHSVATPASTWYAGTHSTDNQATATAGSGWTFTDAPAGGPANMPYALSTVDGGQFMIISGGTTYTVTSSVPVTDNQWHYVVGTYNGTSMKIYVDGMETGTSNSFSGNLPTTKTGAVHIGADYNTTPANFFTGSLDDVRLYSRALSTTEIQSLYDLGQSDKINSSVSQPQGTGRLDSGLAGYWKLDDNTGTSATDSSTNGNTGTLTNGPTWTTGHIGSAVNFDGVDDFIFIVASRPPIQRPMSVLAWIKRNASGELDYIMSERSGTDGMMFSISSSNQIVFSFNPIVDQAVSTSTITDTNWHHIVATIDPSSNVLFYIDGTSAGTSTAGVPVAVNTPLFFGGGTNSLGGAGDADRFSTITIDEARIYNRVLSADEVSQLYRLTSPTGVDTSLKGYWSFNGQDMNGITAYDRSGSNNNGTLTNGPAKVSGKTGQALNFDGANQYISVGNVYNGVKSISFWIKPDNTTKKIIDLSGTANIEVIGQTITVNGFTSPTIYVDGGASSMIDTNWHFVTITTGTGLNASAVDIGRVSSGYFDGRLDEVRMYSEVLTASQITSLYNLGGPVVAATAVFVCGTSTVTFTYKGGSVTYGTVTGADGKCWMDRNLGATQVAVSSTDTASYGDLFQWGRLDDGHQTPTSGTTGTQSTGNVPGNANFIIGFADWRSTQNNNLWGDVNKTNNPCPASWHVPTQTEWATVAGFFSPQTSVGAFNSALKLALAGKRSSNSASLGLQLQGSSGYYWSSSPNGSYAYYLNFSSFGVGPANYDLRAFGFSVRCVKD